MTSSLTANFSGAPGKEVIKMALNAVSDDLSKASELVVQGLISQDDFQQIISMHKNSFKATLLATEGAGLSFISVENIANSAFEVLYTALNNTFSNP